MKRIISFLALVLTLSVQAQNDTLGVSKFTAIYLYKCNTTNAAGRISDNTFNTVAGVVIPTTVNAYQPLELK